MGSLPSALLNTPPSNRPTYSIFPSTPPILIDRAPVSRATHPDSSCDKRCVTINILPDDVLLLIVHFDRLIYLDGLEESDTDGLRVYSGWRLFWKWHRLIHVCQRWRSVVFASPNFLDLRLACGFGKRVELMGIWPPFPIIIKDNYWSIPKDYDFDAAIRVVNPNRVSEMHLFYLGSSELQRLASAMKEQFPALIRLSLSYLSSGSCPPPPPTLPDGFLGGSAPSLQFLHLNSVPFPLLPKFLLSATDLVHLTLWRVPLSGYISPEALVTGLAVSANLKSLYIGFEFGLTLHDLGRRCPPLPSRTVLPALTRFEFQGVDEYLEDLVARIDAPLLDSISITFVRDHYVYDIPQLAQFVRRTKKFEALNEAHVKLDNKWFKVESLPPMRTFDEMSGLRISCAEAPLPFLGEVLNSFIPSVEHLYMYGPRSFLFQEWDPVVDMQWLEIFYPFVTVKNLYVAREVEPRITYALQEMVVGERVTNVLPALEDLFLEESEGPVPKGIGEFVAARQRSGHPVAVSQWKRLPH